MRLAFQKQKDGIQSWYRMGNATRVRVHFTNITMWAHELGVNNVPDNHP